MKVYELIQELCQYDADADVHFRVAAEFEVAAEFDHDSTVEVDGVDQDVTVKVNFDDNVELDEIVNRRNITVANDVTIKLVY